MAQRHPSKDPQPQGKSVRKAPQPGVAGRQRHAAHAGAPGRRRGKEVAQPGPVKKSPR